MPRWLIGCSGFYYRGWKEKFYPPKLPQRQWFEYYCRFFNTVELNVTFYRLPNLETFKSWYNRSPENFRFTAKAPRLISHYKRFRDATDSAKLFYDRVYEGLNDKLGCILFQLHPAIAYSEVNLERIIQTLDPSFTNVLEFRHASWWHPDVFRALRQHHISFCGISYPNLPDEAHMTAPVVYYRFHGTPQLYRSSYSREKLQQVMNALRSFRGVRDIYVYFNNDIDAAAVRNARQLQRLAGVMPVVATGV